MAHRSPAPSPSGVNSPVKMAPDLLQTVVQRGLAARAHQLSANSSALEETILGHRERLGLGEYTDLWNTSMQLWDGSSVVQSENQ